MFFLLTLLFYKFGYGKSIIEKTIKRNLKNVAEKYKSQIRIKGSFSDIIGVAMKPKGTKEETKMLFI